MIVSKLRTLTNRVKFVIQKLVEHLCLIIKIKEGGDTGKHYNFITRDSATGSLLRSRTSEDSPLELISIIEGCHSHSNLETTFP